VIDLALRNGVLHDGTGAPPIRGDLGILGDRIVSVGAPLSPEDAAETIDLGGLAVSPGFVDLHTHSDVSLLSDPGCLSAIEQGITTQAVGLCGFSAAPLSAESLEGMIDEEPVFGFPDVDWSWTTIGGYREAVAKARPATNVTTFVGHNTLRRLVIGGANRPPTIEELERMRTLVREAIDQGARGFTTGLSYAPGLFAAVDELSALAGVAAERGLTYHTHMRYGDREVRGSVDEAIETAERAGVTLNISHMYPRANQPLEEAEVLLGMLERARDRGVEVTFDLTIFNRGGGAWVQSLPAWARDGGSSATEAVIRDPASRARLVDLLTGPDADFWMADWDDQVICKVSRPENAALAGRSIGEIARERRTAPVDTALDLVLEDGQFWIAPTIKNQGHLDQLISSPLCVPIGDGFANHPEKHRAYGLMPKSFGTFPRVLGSYVRDRGVLTLEEGIRRITAEPARRLGLDDRGRLAPGLAADLVVFDPATIANRATEADPAARPAGVERVMVNGEWAVIAGRATGSRTGRSL
jgi:N-acyl-D-aspartate/D-glutamate deacylase